MALWSIDKLQNEPFLYSAIAYFAAPGTESHDSTAELDPLYPTATIGELGSGTRIETRSLALKEDHPLGR